MRCDEGRGKEGSEAGGGGGVSGDPEAGVWRHIAGVFAHEGETDCHLPGACSLTREGVGGTARGEVLAKLRAGVGWW